MALILNLLNLSEAQREAFRAAAPGHEQVFAPAGIDPASGAPLPRERYAQAAAVIGNPPPEWIHGSDALRMLQTRSAGVDRYDAPGVLPARAKLFSASGAYGHSVGEHMFAMLLALMKRLPQYRDRQRGGGWEDLGGVKSLLGAHVLCVGTGDLGGSFARLCKALGAETAGLRRNAALGAEGIDRMYPMDALDGLLPWADVVALMLPRTPETSGLMNANRLHLMKPDAILLNGGRGDAIDCLALARTLAEGRLWGAALDVTDPEPLPPEHPLWQQERALITPHTAGDDHLPDTGDRIAEIALAHLRENLSLLSD